MKNHENSVGFEKNIEKKLLVAHRGCGAPLLVTITIHWCAITSFEKN